MFIPLRVFQTAKQVIAAAKALQPLATAVAHPCDETSLKGALAENRPMLAVSKHNGLPMRQQQEAGHRSCDALSSWMPNWGLS
jgi:hypothetical protein